MSDRPRPGRRPKPPEQLQGAPLCLYLTEAEYATVARLARREGDSLSAFVRARLLRRLGIAHSEKSDFA